MPSWIEVQLFKTQTLKFESGLCHQWLDLHRLYPPELRLKSAGWLLLKLEAWRRTMPNSLSVRNIDDHVMLSRCLYHASMSQASASHRGFFAGLGASNSWNWLDWSTIWTSDLQALACTSIQFQNGSSGFPKPLEEYRLQPQATRHYSNLLGSRA
jgi:hypothetical protein